MSSSPLITVITPCFDDGPTLAMAMASLVAQTVDDWECVVIDDGSGRAVAPVVEAMGDERIRLVEFRQNRGRSVARQRGLDEARGEYVAMLDADDWYYPEKLERQLEVIQADSGLAAVGTGMAVIDAEGDLTGVRTGNREKVQTRVGQKYGSLPIFFGTVMIRRDVARQIRFDPRLERSEDQDYLMRALAGRRYAVMPDVLYAYREYFSDETMGEALCGFRNLRKMFRERFAEAPVELGRRYLWTLVKSGIYKGARSIGRGQWLFERRNREVTVEERRRFEESRRAVLGCLSGSDVRWGDEWQ